jgi:hypothetical protein
MLAATHNSRNVCAGVASANWRIVARGRIGALSHGFRGASVVLPCGVIVHSPYCPGLGLRSGLSRSKDPKGRSCQTLGDRGRR